MTTKPAVLRPVIRAGAEETAGREGALGGDVVCCQTIEAETEERRRHWSLATRARRAMAAPASTALHKREAIIVEGCKCNHTWKAVTRLRCPLPLSEAQVHGYPCTPPGGEPLVRRHPIDHRRTGRLPGPGVTAAAAGALLLVGDDGRA